MKKLTVFLMLIFCVSFFELSAQQTIRWEVSGYATLQIRVDGVLQPEFSSPKTNSSGVLNDVPVGAFVEIIASSSVGNYSLEPIINEDDEWMIEHAIPDYNFTNEEHTALYEWFTMPNDIPMYVKMHA
ncbi:hypothetical protein ACSV4D_06445 [Flavobacterium sp. ARAG 55.4]|uniref:hypothetical protein n=1 Tax=Flavobacterium sp. ARAG 55.4 TaxID=3451357 RepID=UPI003F45DA37